MMRGVVRRVRRSVALAVVVVATGAAAVPAAGPAAAAEAPPKVTVDAGLRGWYDPGDHVVVNVSLEASALFRGRIEVAAPSGATVVRDVEVAGGTTKAFSVVAPTSINDISSPVKVLVLRGESLVATKQISMKVADQVELVGVLPALATRAGKVPDGVTLASDTGRAQLAQLPMEVFDLGATALDVYDTIIATTADLRSMSALQRATLLGWLNQGGRLLLDDDGDLSALPAEWQPGTAGYAWAGRGEVRLVDGQGSAGRWATIIEPSGSATSDDDQNFGGEQTVPVQQDLARRAGVTLPSLGPLLWPLVVYWFVASVLVFVVLKLTRRLTFAWVAIPLLALIAAGGIIAYGNHWRSSGKPVASAFVDGYPGGGVAQVSVLAFSRDGGTSRVRLPDGWQSDSEADVFFGFRSVASEFTTGGDRADVAFRLEAGQVSTATVAGPTTDVGLRVEAVVAGSLVDVTVTNSNPYPMHDVAVFGPGGAKYVGELTSGESKSASIHSDPLPPGFGLFDRAWNNVPMDSSTDQIVERGVWGLAAGSHSMYPRGMVRVAGWTADRPGDASASRLQTRTVVTTTAAVQPGDGPLPAAAVRAVVVRNPWNGLGNGLSDWVFRFTLPTSVDASEALGLEIPAGLTGIEVWNGTSWVTAVPVKRIVQVPANAIIGGVVLARIPNDNQFVFNGDLSVVLRGLTAKEVAGG